MTPIDWETIWQQLEDAFGAYGRTIRGRQAWVDVLFGCEFQDVHQAIKGWLKYNEQPPKPSQILTEVEKILHSRTNSTTVENEDEEKPEAPEIVRRAYMTWMRHSLGVAPPIPGTAKLEPLPLEEAMRVMKKSAESCGQLHLLPLEVQQIEI
jgi:hypothetical protein